MSGNSSSTVSSGKGNTLLSDKQGKGNGSSGRAGTGTASRGYTITPTQYKGKHKTTPVWVVKFDRDLSYEEKRVLVSYMKESLTEGKKTSRGWLDKESGEFYMRSEEVAEGLARMLDNPEAVADAQPLTAEDYREAAIGAEAPGKNKNKKDALSQGKDALSQEKDSPVNRVGVEGLFNNISTKGETKLSDHSAPVKPESAPAKDRRSEHIASDKKGLLYRQEEEVGAINKRFNDDLGRYENGELDEKFRFELEMPSKYLLSAGFPNLPISMRQALLSKKSAMGRHKFSPSSLNNLVKAIQKPLAIFEYSKPNMRNLIVDLTEGGKHFLVGVTLNYKAGEIEINSVSGLFPKDNTEWLKWIQSGKAIRIDGKEKIQAIIDSQRTTNTVESERIGLNLETVAKVVKNFENPRLPEDKILNRQEEKELAEKEAKYADMEFTVPHSYEVTEIELLPEDNSSEMEPTVSPNITGVPHGITKLLKGAEKSYDCGVKLLESRSLRILLRWRVL